MNSPSLESQKNASERVLLERAARLASRQGIATRSPGEQVILFEVQGHLAGLRAQDCVEVVKVDFLTPVPDAAEGLLGLLNIHNNFHCVIDVQRLILGKASLDETAFAFAIVLRHETLRVAVACDLVLRVENILDNQKSADGSFRVEERFATMINPQALLAPYENGHEPN